MRIITTEFIEAKFYMKNEPLNDIDVLPRISPAQVHDKNIIIIDGDNTSSYVLPERPEADGILLMTPKFSASLRFADCAPVMLWGSGEWVMLLHSGYKGTVLNISGNGVDLIRKIYGDEKIFAWVGPCIGREYFRKLNDEWTQRGISAFHSDNYEIEGENVYFDLAGEIRRQLFDSGVSGNNITLSGINTLTDPRCYSYRKGDIKERMTLYARIKKGLP